jgi:hypothetical protein
MILAFVLAAVTATFHPPAPKVGDLIRIDFAAPVTLEASPEYEVVSRNGAHVVIRTFAPKPFVLSGTTGGVRFTNLVVPVGSVLKKNDDLAPAPLAPPVPVPYPRAPFIAIGLAALAAAIAWTAVWLRGHRRMAPAVPAVPVEERYRRAVEALRENPRHPRRWAALADETRAYLAATRPHLGTELTTSELLPRLGPQEAVVADILRQGDREKFSPWGAEPADFDAVAARALLLAAPMTAMEAIAA